MPARRVIRVAREHLLAAVSRSRFSAVLVILLCLIAAGWTIANVRHVYERAHLEPTVPAGIVYDWESYASVGHRIGPPDAAIVLVVFMDYQCRTCRRFASRLAALQEKHPSSLAAVFRHFPLTYGGAASAAAVAAECAALQGQFESLHGLLLKAWADIEGRGWERIAERADVRDRAAFMECMASANPDSLLRVDLDDAKRLGVKATPTFLVAAEVYVGLPWDFERIVERHISQAAQRIVPEEER